MFGTDFDTNSLYVIYIADFPRTSASDCVWMIPGTWMEDA
jgi:hypothetical protein